MKISRFKGEGIRGYMDFDIPFNDDLTFLIGINGSGKTTVLKLISALITPSYFDLVQIEFKHAELHIKDVSDKSISIISCDKHAQLMTIKYAEKEGKIPIINMKRDGYPKDFYVDKFRREQLAFEELEVIQLVKKIKTPLFLGLNRRVFDNVFSQLEKENGYFRRESFNIDFLFDAVDKALNDIQELFYNRTRQNTSSQYSLSERFRKKVFEESLKISQPHLSENINYGQELQVLNIKKEKLNNAIVLLDMKDLKDSFNDFFQSISDTLTILTKTPAINSKNQLNEEYYHALLNWIVNSIQLERVDSTIKYANEYAQNIQKLKEPFIRFVDSVNSFFDEAHKKIKVAENGDIKIMIEGTKKTNSIYELSSGEKQLIIIFAHVAFHKKLTPNTAPIFIIDEPELSLHISWQEKFVDALLQANPDTQFIMATHAPAIIAKVERKKSCIDLSEKE